MKVRNGFVSNSSSSSFVCVICGEAEGGYDIELDDVYMYECENGHDFHEHCTSKESQKELEEIDDRYDIDPKHCPICSMTDITNSDGYRYLKKKTGMSNSDVLNEVKEKFGSYKKFMEFLREK